MELLKSIRVKAANWVDITKTVEGTLFVADRITLQSANPQRNSNGYLLFIVDDKGMKHIICPDTLEVVGLNENSETAKAVYDVTMKMASAGFTIAETETFWKDCVTSAELMIESKKRGLQPQSSMSGVDLIYLERKRQIEVEGFTAQNDAKYTDDELVSAAICYAMNPAQRNFENDENVSLDLMIWPWNESAWKPSPEDRIKELTKAGALIAAEIDRLKSI